MQASREFQKNNSPKRSLTIWGNLRFEGGSGNSFSFSKLIRGIRLILLHRWLRFWGGFKNWKSPRLSKRYQRLLFFSVPWLLACGILAPPTPIAQLAPTRTPRPTFTPTNHLDSNPTTAPVLPTTTATLGLSTDTATSVVMPTDMPLPTPTSADTPTPTPTPTETPVPPTSTPVPPPPPPTNTPVPPTPSGPVIGQYGVSGKVTARDKTNFAVGEKAFFTYEANNHTSEPVSFILLGIKASNGQFNTSWINPDVISPGVPFRHDDGLTFNTPGTYQVYLAICYAFCDGGETAIWEEYRDGAATITVQ